MINNFSLSSNFQLSAILIFLALLFGCGQPPSPDQNDSVLSAFQEGLNAPVLTTTPSPTNTGSSRVVATAESQQPAGAEDSDQTEQQPLEEIKIEVPVPTATTAPISSPPFQTLDFNNLPATQNDLAFVQAGVLKRWSAADQAVVSIYAPAADPQRFPQNTFAEVAKVDFSADGKRAAVVVRYVEALESEDDGSGDTESLNFANGPTQFDIKFIDMISQESWTLVEGIQNEVGEIALSPDKAAVAFTTFQGDIEPSSNKGKIFLIGTPSSRSERTLTLLQECESECTSISWRQDSELMVFGDMSGIYIMNINGARPTLLFNNIDNTDDNPLDIVQHLPVAWALNGRGLLVKRIDRLSLTIDYAVLDVAGRQLIEPDPDLSLGFAAWLEDSRLATAIQNANGGWQLQTLIVDYESQSIRLDETYALELAGSVFGLVQSADNRFVFGVQNSDQLQEAGLYRLVSFSEQPERQNGVPNIDGPAEIIWNSNGSEAVQSFGNQTFLATADGSLFVFREHVWGFKWMGE